MENRINKLDFYRQLCGILPAEQICRDEPMSRHTSFRVGGPADFYVMPDFEQAGAVLALCEREQVPCRVIGNGSNLLVGDFGISGVVLALGKPAGHIRLDGQRLFAGAGALLSQVAAAALREGLGGLEFAAGIPGSVGGAVVMNAGAYGGEIKDVVTRAKVLARDGKARWMDGGELELSYRHSCIPEKNLTVLEAEFLLHEKPREEIQALMDDLKNRRQEKQPLEYPSAGSTFKRPQGYFAGKLIMDAGLAGACVGGAQVSEKHCGFLINKGGSSAADILALIRRVQRQVQETFGVALEPEVKFMGKF